MTVEGVVSKVLERLPENHLPENHFCSLSWLPESSLRERGMVSKDFLVQLKGYGLTTAEIHYHMPDHPKLLQQFIWQDYDLAPLFPGLKQFLEFWQRGLEGALHSVRVAHAHLIKPSEWKLVDGLFRLN